MKGGDAQMNSSIFFKNIQIYRARRKNVSVGIGLGRYMLLFVEAGRKKFFYPRV